MVYLSSPLLFLNSHETKFMSASLVLQDPLGLNSSSQVSPVVIFLTTVDPYGSMYLYPKTRFPTTKQGHLAEYLSILVEPSGSLRVKLKKVKLRSYT